MYILSENRAFLCTMPLAMMFNLTVNHAPRAAPPVYLEH